MHSSPNPRAFSLIGNLKFHICGLLWVGAQLARVLRNIAGVDGIPLRAPDGLDDFHRVIEILAVAQSHIFVDEVNESIGTIRFLRSGAVRISFAPASQNVSVVPVAAGGRVITRADGFSTKYEFQSYFAKG